VRGKVEAIAPSGALPLVRPKGSLFGTDAIGLPTGAWITPDAAPGAKLFDLDPHVEGARGFRAGNAVASALSPDGSTLLVLTSGYNRVFEPATGEQRPEASTEWVFVYDVSTGEPRETQAVAVPNAFGGIAFDPKGERFYVGGGSDDVLRAYAREGGTWREAQAPVRLGHGEGLGLHEGPYAAGVAVTASGARVLVANHENDTVSVVDPARGAVVAEIAAGSAGAGSGLAYRIAESGYRLNIPRMFAALLLLSAAGIVIYGLLALASHLVLRRWHESALGKDN